MSGASVVRDRLRVDIDGVEYINSHYAFPKLGLVNILIVRFQIDF